MIVSLNFVSLRSHTKMQFKKYLLTLKERLIRKYFLYSSQPSPIQKILAFFFKIIFYRTFIHCIPYMYSNLEFLIRKVFDFASEKQLNRLIF